MKRFRGFRLGRKMKGAFKWIVRSGRKTERFARPAQSPLPNLVCRLTRFLSRGAKYLRNSFNLSPGYIQLGLVKEPKEVEVPKGHLAVYVGESDGDTRRVVVPVIYFNHPLFGELLKEAERVYGYKHEGGIIIPCEYSEFEKVKMRIASSWDYARRRRFRC